MFLAHQRKTVNNPTEDFEIFVMNADGTKQKQLTNTANTVKDFRPSWQPIP
jgi:hypothetical protein